MPRLILFDLDQTLVDAMEHHTIAYKKAFKEVYKVDAQLIEIKFAGKMVQNIIREIGELKGIHRNELESKLTEAIKKIEFYFKGSVEKGRITVLPGVVELLKKLKESNHFLGVITGNPKIITTSILKKSGLEGYFDVFVCGAQDKDRVQLVGMAMAEAEGKSSTKFLGKDVAIVGDSIHDIESGKPYGSLMIAMTTGFYSRDDLLQHSPDYIFEDMTDPQLLKVLL